MSRLGVGRIATRFASLVAVVAVLSGCGTPPQLDQQEQVAFARECTSLIERNLSEKTPPRVAALGTDTLDLDHPSSFYSVLERLRGPSTFDLHDPKRQADTARQPLDECSTHPKVLSSLFGATTTTTSTTSTTSTTVPGS